MVEVVADNEFGSLCLMIMCACGVTHCFALADDHKGKHKPGAYRIILLSVITPQCP